MDDVAAALAAENRRLRREAKHLEARVRALESSRWYRLNPRQAWRRLAGKRGPAPDPAAAQKETHGGPPPAAGAAARAAPAMLERFEQDVVRRGNFSRSWAIRHPDRWEPLFQALEGGESRVLEIGSFEGLWSSLVLWRLPQAVVTCIDTFAGGLDHAGTDTVPVDLERIFDENVALVDASRVRKLVGDSKLVLPRLVSEHERFELVYVDASHLGLDVIVDAALSWQLLETGGFLVFDDYLWAELGDDPLLRPGPAVDAFLSLVKGKHEPVFASDQLAVRKTI